MGSGQWNLSLSGRETQHAGMWQQRLRAMEGPTGTSEGTEAQAWMGMCQGVMGGHGGC